MTSPTISLVGLAPDDALELLEWKLQRARAARNPHVRIVYGSASPRLQRRVEELLERWDGVISVARGGTSTTVIDVQLGFAATLGGAL